MLRFPLLLVVLTAITLPLTQFSETTARQVPKEEPKEDPKDPLYDGKKASEWVDVLVNGTSARQRALAIDALGKLWTEKRFQGAVPAIGRALRVDSSVAVRSRAALALGGLRESEVLYLISEKDGIGVKDLVDAMGAEKDSRVKTDIARAIARFPVIAKLAVVPLTGALKDAEPVTRAVVAEAIGLAGADAKSAAAGLAPLLDDKDMAVRRAVVIALGRINPEGAAAIADAMAKMLAAEKDIDLRGQLILSLRLLDQRSPAVVSALTAVLSDPEEELRRRAVRTLGVFGTASQSAADTFLKLAKTDKAKDIRVDAVRAFGSAVGPEGVKKQIKELLSLLSDPDYEVRLAVVDEVGALGNDLLMDEETIKALRVRLSDPHVKVREAVLLAIRKIQKKPEPKTEPEPKKEP